MKASGEEHVNKVIRVCNTMRAKGSNRQLLKAVSSLGEDAPVTQDERAVIKKLLKRRILKPMRGRWGSFHKPRGTLIAVAMSCRADRFVLATLMKSGFKKEPLKRKAQNHRATDHSHHVYTFILAHAYVVDLLAGYDIIKF